VSAGCKGARQAETPDLGRRFDNRSDGRQFPAVRPVFRASRRRLADL